MITIIGLGFVGLTTALGFSNKGYKVYGYDIDDNKVEKIKSGTIPFYEEKLNDELNKSLNKNFYISENLKEAVNNSKFIFYCVGTPCQDDGSANLECLLNSIDNTLKVMDKNEHKIIIIKSTVPPSTTMLNVIPYIEKLGFKVGKNIGVANNPEFLREGCAWDDFINPDRIVIGQCDEKTGKEIEKLYDPFEAPVYKVSLNTAEYIKYLSNTLLATLISYSNEMSMIGDTIGNIDIKKAFNILLLDKRWIGKPAQMSTYVFPGCGFGGYCLPKDTKAIYCISKKKGIDAKILDSVLEINKKIKEYVVNKVVLETNKDDYIGILGLAFKPNSDDVRETPAKDIIKDLIARGYNNIIVYDPIANENFKFQYNLPIEYAENISEISIKSKVLIITTAWKQFREEESKFKNKKVFDFRYMLGE